MSIEMDDFVLARVLHVLAIIPWIGGVAFVTTALMPSIRRNNPPDARLSAFHRVEQSFAWRSEEHTSELQSLMRSSYAVFCLKKKNKILQRNQPNHHTQPS